MRVDFGIEVFSFLHRSLFSQRRLLAVLLLFASGVAAASRINTQTPAISATAQEKSASYATAREHARAIAKEWLARGIPGFNVAVAIDGKIIYSEGFGYADLEQRVPAWQITKFRIGSVSKPLTSAALMKLVEQGEISVYAARSSQHDGGSACRHHSAKNALLFRRQKRAHAQRYVCGQQLQMGWFIGKSKSGKRIFEHSGGSVGGTSELILYPDMHLVVAFVCNYDGESWKGEEVQSLGEAFEK